MLRKALVEIIKHLTLCHIGSCNQREGTSVYICWAGYLGEVNLGSTDSTAIIVCWQKCYADVVGFVKVGEFAFQPSGAGEIRTLDMKNFGLPFTKFTLCLMTKRPFAKHIL